MVTVQQVQGQGSKIQRRGGWRQGCIVVAGAVLAIAWLYRAVLVSQPAAGFGWDTLESYWPDLAFLVDSLRDGELPLWNPHDRGGWPFWADPERGFWYPLNWVIAALCSEVGWPVIQAKVLGHHLLGVVFLYGFLRSRRLPASACAVGAIGWIASTPILIHKASSIVWPLFWTPFLWWSLDRWREQPGVRRALLAGCIVAWLVSAGSPPGAFYALLATGYYAGLRIAGDLVGGRRRGRKWVRSVWVIGGIAIGLLLPWWWAGNDLLALSGRAIRGASYALSLPLPVADTLVGVLVPTHGRIDAFVGLLVLLLGILGIGLSPRRDGGMPIAMGVGGLLALLLSFGAATPLLPWLVTWIPGFDLFRVASRYKLVFSLFACVGAAYGCAAVIDRGRCRALIAWLGLFAGVWWGVYAATESRSDLRVVPTLLVVVVAVLAVALVARRWRARAAFALVVLALWESPHLAHPDGQWATEPRPEKDRARVLASLEGVDSPRPQWRIYDEFVLEQRAGSRLGLRDFRGYPAGDPLTLRRYAEVLSVLKRAPEILGLFNVRYVLSGRHHRLAARMNHVDARTLREDVAHFRAVSRSVFEHRHPAPWLSWYGRVRPVGGDALAQAWIGLAAEGAARTDVLLEPADRTEAWGDLLELAQVPAVAPVAGRVDLFDRNEVRGHIVAPQRGIVVLNEVAYPGWQVWVDGREALSLRVDGLLRGVPVQAGKHEILWRYQPRGIFGWWCLWLAISLVGLAILWWELRQPRSPLASGSPARPDDELKIAAGASQGVDDLVPGGGARE